MSRSVSGGAISGGRRFALAAAMFALLALPASAWAVGESFFGTVTIIDRDAGAEVIVEGEPRVCGLAFVFDLATGETEQVVGFTVRTWVAGDPFQGAVALEAQSGPTDANGVIRFPADGWYELPEGRYNVLWDDEFPVDASAGIRSFTVECAAEATPTPTPTPTPVVTPTPTPEVTPTPTPTPTPEGSVGPTAGTPTPEASVGGETATPDDGVGAITLPPTDMAGPGEQPASSRGFLVVLTVLAAGAAVAFLLRPRRGTAR